MLRAWCAEAKKIKCCDALRRALNMRISEKLVWQIGHTLASVWFRG